MNSFVILTCFSHVKFSINYLVFELGIVNFGKSMFLLSNFEKNKFLILISEFHKQLEIFQKIHKDPRHLYV